MNARQYRHKHNRQKGECTWCGGPVSRPRRTWCSDECLHEWRTIYDWPYVRQLVFERDKGVCAECGFDSEKVNRIFRQLTYPLKRYLARQYVKLGFPFEYYRDWWEAHHVVPRRDGGTNELNNLITLCVPCHHATFGNKKAHEQQGKK